MPSLCGITWIDEIDVAIRDRAAAYGLPLDIAYAIIAAESGFDSYAAGDIVIDGSGTPTIGPDGHRGMINPLVQTQNGPVQVNGVAWESYRSPGAYGCSHGLLQLNACGGQGQGMSWSQLVNPWTNCDVGFAYPNISTAFRMCWTPTIAQYDYICCVCTNSGHPGPVACDDSRIAKIFNIWVCMYQALVSGQIPPVPNPPPVAPSPTPPLPNPLPPLPSPVPPTTPTDWTPLILSSIGVSLAIMVLDRNRIFKKIIVKGDVSGGINKSGNIY